MTVTLRWLEMVIPLMLGVMTEEQECNHHIAFSYHKWQWQFPFHFKHNPSTETKGFGGIQTQD